MSFIHKVAAQRGKFLDALDANEGDINLDIFEDFYPDQAHFIFELLQNAEDAEATEAALALSTEGCLFEHNGRRAFNEQDVRAITGIHNSTKSKAPDQIGKFGIGFKSVFAYTLTPVIHSKDFSFKISRLVLPEPVQVDPGLGALTRFELPFNNPRKGSAEACEEIRAGLEELAETTLLFLSNLKRISWKTGPSRSGEVLCLNHSENLIEVLKRVGSTTIESSHFLRFSESVPGLENRSLAIAFDLEYLPGAKTFNPKEPLAKQFKVVPANPGRVAVFFPAQKETSGLRFHLHGPFVPELSRASIKETPVNDPLFEQLAKLAATSLHRIRDLNLLTGDFLGVLPNPQEVIPPRYQTIRAAIIEEMNKEPLTPTHSRSHAPARNLLQGKAPLKELLSREDLKLLVPFEGEPRQWAIGASQRHSDQDRFLAGLAIQKWDVEDFVELLRHKVPKSTWGNPDREFMRWLSAKADDWHQRLYSLLYKEHFDSYEVLQLKGHPIVRLSDESYGAGGHSYFPTTGVEHDKSLPRVAKGIYSSGRNKKQQLEARKFLEWLGVSEVGEVEEVQAILAQRYTFDVEEPEGDIHLADLKRFIATVEKQPDTRTMFAQFYIFESAADDWRTPGGLFLDSPYLQTGLRAYYEAMVEDASKAALSNRYQRSGIPVDSIQRFAEAIGVQRHVEVEMTCCSRNPDWDYLRSVPGERYTSPIDQDWIIPGLEKVLSQPTVEISRLLWRTMCHLPQHANRLKARYRKNEARGSHYADSQLVHQLRNSSWVPQGNGEFVRPHEASEDSLPKGFTFDKDYEWLNAVHFGQQNRQLIEQKKRTETVAKQLGFSDAKSLERALQFAALPEAQQEHILGEVCRRQELELPESEPHNPERRAQHLRGLAANAPHKAAELRTRSVSLGKDEVKQEAEEYLRAQYTNDEGVMICQICKAELPFRLDDGEYYFEKQEFLPELTRRHYQNYLALCPNHSAMFQHVNGSRDLMKRKVCEIVGNELEMVLAKKDTTVYFTRTHLADLRTVVQVDSADQDSPDDRGSTGSR